MKKILLRVWLRGAWLGRDAALLLLMAGTLALLGPPLYASTATNNVTDNDLAQAVDEQLSLDEGVTPNDIDVSAGQGIVTLSGIVGDLLAKERAITIAESIRGVRGVIDRMTVAPASVSDEAIRKDILTTLMQDPATESYQVAVSVHNGVVTLTGSAGSYEDKKLAERLAEGVSGIKAIHNEVTINNQVKRSDHEIAADVQARLDWDIWLNGYLVHATATNGTVTLAGAVGSAIGKERAFDDGWVNGVTWVDDSHLNVEPWARNPERRDVPFADRSDSQIKQAVLTAFRHDPRVASYSDNFEVNVKGGVIILGGSVANLKARTAAEEDARDIVGVWSVENFLKVRPNEQLTDSEMAEQLRAYLRWDPWLVGCTIDAAVIHRVAYLSGAVDSNAQKAQAQDDASRIRGIVLVRNRLKVEAESPISYYSWPPGEEDEYDVFYFNRPPYDIAETCGPGPYPSDEQIKKNIERAMFWSPFVDRKDVTVSVAGGVATLSGEVGTWIGWREADKDALKSGAAYVINHLKVRRHGWS